MFPYFLKHMLVFQGSHLHALSPPYGDKIESFISFDAGHVSLYFPFRIKWKQIISKRKYPVTDFYPF